MNSCDLVRARIIELSEEKNINPHKLSVLAGIPASTMKSILNGQSQNPGIVNIEKICNGLGISIPEFFDTKEFAELSKKKK